MVTTENEEVLRVFDLIREQEADSFKRLLASIDIVSQEQVISLGWESTIFEQSQQIIVLSVYVTWSLSDIIETKQIRRHLPQIFIGASSSSNIG